MTCLAYIVWTISFKSNFITFFKAWAKINGKYNIVIKAKP